MREEGRLDRKPNGKRLAKLTMLIGPRAKKRANQTPCCMILVLLPSPGLTFSKVRFDFRYFVVAYLFDSIRKLVFRAHNTNIWNFISSNYAV